MTVEEARTKECRMFVELSQTFQPREGETQIYHNPARCSANACMAWRWFDTEIKNEGYCGLAGKEGAE